MKDRLHSIRMRIEAAALEAGRRPQDVQLVAVTKTVPAKRIQEAITLGVDVIGESYIQEARDKFNTLYTEALTWHFIGHLQSNKAKYAVKMFDLIHSVDSLKLSQEIDKQARKINKVQKVLVQVNIAEEATKSGILKDETVQLITQISQLDHVAVKGLMTLPPYFNAPEKARKYFRALRELQHQIESLNIRGVSMAALSMGMTGDFEVAIQEGATMVRIGTAIFGERR